MAHNDAASILYQVLRYDVGQYYHQHMDVLSNDQAGPRVATVLLYFNTPGGRPCRVAFQWLTRCWICVGPSLSVC